MLLPTELLLITFSILVAGTYLFTENLRLSPAICQVVASLAVAFLVSTVFLLGPVVRHAEEAGLSGESIYRRITLALGVNPFAVLAYSVFDENLLHDSPMLYATRAADFQHGVPRWGVSALGYALAGTFLGAAAFGLREARRRWAEAA